MDITNKTRKPIAVPLPAGKRLFLPPGKTGQITPKDQEHPPIAALIEAGDLEVKVGSGGRKSGGGGKSGGAEGQRTDGTGGMRKFGDG